MLSKIYLICQNIRSLHNVGSIFRSADAFAVSKIYLCGYTGHPPHTDISKTALGAEKTVPWEVRKQTWKVIEEMREKRILVVALEKTKNSKPLNKFLSSKFKSAGHSSGVALVLGNEVRGVTREMLSRADVVLHIPMYGKKESLNVSVAAGIALYHLRII